MTCSIDACIFNTRGNPTNICCGSGANSENNVSRTTVRDATGFVCFSEVLEGETCGAATNMLLHGIDDADSRHTSNETSSSCGTTLNVQIDNCI